MFDWFDDSVLFCCHHFILSLPRGVVWVCVRARHIHINAVFVLGIYFSAMLFTSSRLLVPGLPTWGANEFVWMKTIKSRSVVVFVSGKPLC